MSTLSIILICLGVACVLGYLVASIIKMKNDEKAAYKQYCIDKEEYMIQQKQNSYVIESFKEWKKLDKTRKQAYRKAKQVKHVEFDDKE